MTEYKLVPIEPTVDMSVEGIINWTQQGAFVNKIYKAMLSAAPQPQPIDVEKIQEELYGKDGFGSRCTIRRECIELLAAHYNITKKDNK